MNGTAPVLQLRVCPEELVELHLMTFSPADECRLADDLRARRHLILDELAEAIDEAIDLLERRAHRHRWTPGEIRGRRAA